MDMSAGTIPTMNDESRLEGKKSPAKRRRSVPKVRTGCKTCKQRHVRCDERKLSCKNCEDFRVRCPGYPIKDTGPRRPLPLVPKPQQALAPMAGGILFMDSDEHRYFKLAFSDVGPDVSSSDLNLPSIIRTMVQSNRSDEALRRGVACIGALKDYLFHKRRLMMRTEPKLPAYQEIEDEADIHRTWAMREYANVLVALRSSKDIRIVLVGCWLVFYFEALTGSLELAASHMEVGSRILQDWLAQNENASMMLTGLSPRPNIVEDAIISAYMGLDRTPSVSANVPRSPFNTAGDPVASHLSIKIPQVFTTLSQAQAHLQKVMVLVHRHAGSPYILMPVITASAPVLTLEDDPATSYDDLSKALEAWSVAFSLLESTIPPTPYNGIALTAMKIHHLNTSLLFKSTTFASEIEHDNLWPYYQHLMTLCSNLVSSLPQLNINDPAYVHTPPQLEPPQPLYRPAGIGINRSHSHLDPPVPQAVPSTSAYSPTTTEIDAVTPQLFDILIPLARIARCCRNPFLRRQAIALLNENAVDATGLHPWGRGGVGVISAKVAEWIVGVEEEGQGMGKGGGFVGSIRGVDRVRVLRVEVEVEERRGRVRVGYPARLGVEREGEFMW